MTSRTVGSRTKKPPLTRPVPDCAFSSKPTIYIYETYPGGVGFSEKLFTHHDRLLEAATDLLKDCPCTDGCPSCVGPATTAGMHGKQGAVKLLELAREN